MELEEIVQQYNEAHEELMMKAPLEWRKKLIIMEDSFNALRDIIEAFNT